MDPPTPTVEELLGHDRFVRALARRLAGDVATAEDVAQETWAEWSRRRPEARASLRGWLRVVARHVASNARRGRERRWLREAAVARREAIPPETQLLEREELRRRLVAAVLALGKPASTIVLLHYFDGLAPAEVARRCHSSAYQVHWQFGQAGPP